MTESSPLGRKLLKVALLLLLVFAPIEGLSFVAGKILGRSGVLYAPAAFRNYADYVRDRDPLLGWPSPLSVGYGEYDRAGSRIVPSFPDPAMPSCVALFGDSFTWGDEVKPEQAYGNVLAKLAGCRVANYGVGGYGTDQAYLRYAKVIKDPAPIVILGHFSDNITRNVNQERGFLTNQTLGLKPRFVLENGALRLIPLPALSEAEYAQLGTRGQELLPYDYFAPGGPSGVKRLSFPYSFAVARSLLNYRVQARLKSRPSYAEFYAPSHPSGALQVTEAILNAFVKEAEQRGQKALILLIPDEKDLLWLRAHQSLPYAELAQRLRAAQLVVPEVAEELNKSLEGRAPCELYTHCGGAHFNPGGYAKLAGIVFAKLKELGWLRPAQAP